MTATLEQPTATDTDRLVLQSRVAALKTEIAMLRRAKQRSESALAQRCQALSRLESRLAMCGPARVPFSDE